MAAGLHELKSKRRPGEPVASRTARAVGLVSDSADQPFQRLDLAAHVEAFPKMETAESQLRDLDRQVLVQCLRLRVLLMQQSVELGAFRL